MQFVAWGDEGKKETDLVIIVIAVTVNARMGFLWCLFPWHTFCMFWIDFILVCGIDTFRVKTSCQGCLPHSQDCQLANKHGGAIRGALLHNFCLCFCCFCGNICVGMTPPCELDVHTML